MANPLSSKEWLKKYLKKGETIYTISRHVSKSGMLRHISFYIMRDNQPYCIDGNVAKVLDMKFNKNNDALKVSGTGMDMGYHIVHNLSMALFDDGYYLAQNRWL
tara:strand:+ start:39 stop:350 length:312 start_codon:yes stop_codon:yes gene_type:complete